MPRGCFSGQVSGRDRWPLASPGRKVAVGADMQQPIETTVQSGAIIAGKYRVDRLLDVGGMGAVAVATHIELQQQVAIKFLLPKAARG